MTTTVGLIIIATLAVFFEYALLTGIKVGTLSGKVYSISQRPIGVGWKSGIGVHKVDVAKVKLTTGEFIQVRCESYCRLDQKIDITIYKSFLTNKLRYVYERT